MVLVSHKLEYEINIRNTKRQISATNTSYNLQYNEKQYNTWNAIQYNEKKRNLKNIVFDLSHIFNSWKNFMDQSHHTHSRYPRHQRCLADSIKCDFVFVLTQQNP